MEILMESTPGIQAEKRLNLFERYLTVWVGLCMVVGVALGTWVPGVVETFRNLEFGEGSHMNVPIAVLIWLMIIPMMMKVDFASIKSVGKRPKGLMVTLFVNWVVKPFSMAFLAWLFFRHVFVSFHNTPVAPSDRCTAQREQKDGTKGPWSAQTIIPCAWKTARTDDPLLTTVNISW